MECNTRAALVAAAAILVLVIVWYYNQDECYAATGFAFDGAAGLFSVGVPAGQTYTVGAACRVSKVLPTGATPDDHKAVMKAFEGCKGVVCGMSKSLCNSANVPAVVLKVPVHFNSFCLPHATLVLSVKKYKTFSRITAGAVRCPNRKNGFLQGCAALPR